ncbi:MAG: synthase [Candidatus Binatota bacterium]|nr:synthase [Candidatus Binatota bacterium]
MLEFPPDASFIYQIVLILVLWAVLKRVVFDRFLANLQQRDEKTRGALDEAQRLRAEAATLRAEYESALAEFRRRGFEERESLRREAEREERALLETARGEAARQLEAVRQRVRAEVTAARAELGREAEELAEQVAQSLLERKVS